MFSTIIRLIIFRIRGYQYKSEEKGESRKNPIAYKILDDKEEELAESLLSSSDMNAEELESKGFAQSVER